MHAASVGQLFLAWDGSAAVGAAAGVSFGATGWVGGVAVASAHRGRGIAAQATRAVLSWLEGRGARTISLLATPVGRPVYERLGFVGEGAYVEFAAPSPAPPRASARPLALEDLEAARALDAWATGEDRLPMLEAGFPAGWGAPADGALAGTALATPWSGTPIVARDPEAGAALVRATWAAVGDGPHSRCVPAENAAALALLRGDGFEETRRMERMRRGPALPWRPEAIWGTANRFWA